MPGLKAVIFVALAAAIGWELIQPGKPWTLTRVSLLACWILVLAFFFYARVTGLTVTWDPFDPG